MALSRMFRPSPPRREVNTDSPGGVIESLAPPLRIQAVLSSVRTNSARFHHAKVELAHEPPPLYPDLVVQATSHQWGTRSPRREQCVRLT